jgi:predicted nucleic acid-binding Zn ribbon protein
MIYTKENPLKITSLKEITGNIQWYEFTCEVCGETDVKHFKTMTYMKQLVCRHCSQKVRKESERGIVEYWNERETAFHIDEPNPKTLVRWYTYKCKVCGKTVIERNVTVSKKSELVCGPCLRAATKLENHGSTTYNNLAKAQATCLSRYGVDNPYKLDKVVNRTRTRSKEWYKKRTETSRNNCVERYGSPNGGQTPEVRERIKKTCLKKYGGPAPVYASSVRSKMRAKYDYNGILFDSSWELATWIYHKNHGIPIEKCNEGIPYEFEGKTCTFFPDFVINGEKVEIKGDFLMTSVYGPKTNEKLKTGVKFLYSEDVAKFIDYVNNTYGKDHLKSFRKIKTA